MVKAHRQDLVSVCPGIWGCVDQSGVRRSAPRAERTALAHHLTRRDIALAGNLVGRGERDVLAARDHSPVANRSRCVHFISCAF